MKFGKTYSEFIEKEASIQLAGCSYVEFKKLKKVLKRCPMHDSPGSVDDINVNTNVNTSVCNASCSKDSRACTTPSLKPLSSTQTKKKHRKGSPVSTLTSGVCPSSCPGTLTVQEVANVPKNHLNFKLNDTRAVISLPGSLVL